MGNRYGLFLGPWFFGTHCFDTHGFLPIVLIPTVFAHSFDTHGSVSNCLSNCLFIRSYAYDT